MPKNVISVRYNTEISQPYVTDNGEELPVSSRFVAPPDVSDTQIGEILTAIQAQALDADLAPSVCSETGTGQLRRLRFFRANGGSMSVPVRNRSILLTAAISIRDILNAAGSDVVCIQAEGEEFPNLNDRLSLTYNGAIATSHVSDGESKQFYYSGIMNYIRDISAETSATFLSVKSITDNEDAPATQLGTVWSGCVGDFADVLSCGNGRRKTVQHRRYVLTFATSSDPGDATASTSSEIIELPVVSALPANILTCGQNAASLAGLYCIGYRGESNSRFHKILD